MERIPTVFGRLRHVASLRDGNTGKYRHAGLAQRVGEDSTDQLLRESHMTVFSQWLCFSLAAQREEVESYFSGIDENKRTIISSWLSLEPYSTWVPSESRDAERDLFCSDMGLIVEVLRNEQGIPSRDPDS